MKKRVIAKAQKRKKRNKQIHSWRYIHKARSWLINTGDYPEHSLHRLF